MIMVAGLPECEIAVHCKCTPNSCPHYSNCELLDWYGSTDTVPCESCAGEVLVDYDYLISKLRDADLIPHDFKTLCCDCYGEKEEIREK